MWGNKEGWFISAIIAGVMSWMIFSLGQAEGISAPSGQFRNLAEPIALPIAPAEVLPGVMTEDRDAGEQYWQAIRIYRENPKPYDKFDITKAAKAGELEALELIVQGTSGKRASLFVKRPETLVNYKYPWPELDAIFNLGQLCNSIGHYYVVSKKNADEELAKKYLHAGFSLGAKLFDERLIHSEMLNGVKLMQGAADSLKELAKRKGDIDREQQLEQFGEQTTGYYTSKVKTLYEKVVGAGRSDVQAYAGDVFELAQRNPDRMWQVEAILKVGRYRFNATRSGDQIGAARMLGDDPGKYGYEDWTQHQDPAVRTAGKAAKELTIEQFRTIQ